MLEYRRGAEKKKQRGGSDEKVQARACAYALYAWMCGYAWTCTFRVTTLLSSPCTRTTGCACTVSDCVSVCQWECSSECLRAFRAPGTTYTRRRSYRRRWWHFISFRNRVMGWDDGSTGLRDYGSTEGRCYSRRTGYCSAHRGAAGSAGDSESGIWHS